jgi:hypothetical protein
LFLDAYDVFYNGNTKEILRQYATFDRPLLFGSELSCSPSELESKYPEHTKVHSFRYLNSGLFIGKVWSIRECFQGYVFQDDINDQFWWKIKFLERSDLIELDYNNKIFLNCHGLNKIHINIVDDKIQYEGKNIQILHFNGSSKAIMNKYAKIDPNPYFSMFPHISMEYYMANGGE